MRAALRKDSVNKSKKKDPKLTMSTEAAGVPASSEEYWVDVNAKTEGNIIVVKPGPKPTAKSKDIHWPGYCLEGCCCDVYAKKREEPRETSTAIQHPNRMPKKPSKL